MVRTRDNSSATHIACTISVSTYDDNCAIPRSILSECRYMTNRIFCIDCWKFMEKVQTGFNIRIGGPHSGRAVRGDRYECKSCGRTVLGDFGEPFDLAEGMAEQE